MEDCLYCKIANGTVPSHIIWEDVNHIAFLSIFPNTEGFTILIPKKHHSGYVFDMPDDELSRLIIAAKNIGKILDAKLDDVGRTGCVFENMGVDHAHVKLIPMHGTKKIAKWEKAAAYMDKFFEKYEGYLSSHESVRVDDKILERLAKKIKN